MHYYLGIAYAKTELDKAIGHFQAALAGDVDQDDARFQLASALDRSGAFGPARTEYDRFATAHPQSQLAVFAMRRSATLSRGAVPAGAPPVAPVWLKPLRPAPPRVPAAPAAPPSDSPADRAGEPSTPTNPD
jgi:hypothetical protein